MSALRFAAPSGGIALAALWLLAAPLRAEWMSGAQLEETCTASAPVDRAMCLSYVMGVLDGMRGMERPPRVPDDVSAGQVRDVVVRYLAENPARGPLQGREVVRAAVAAQWPALQPRAKTKPAAKRKPVAAPKPASPTRKRRRG